MTRIKKYYIVLNLLALGLILSPLEGSRGEKLTQAPQVEKTPFIINFEASKDTIIGTMTRGSIDE